MRCLKNVFVIGFFLTIGFSISCANLNEDDVTSILESGIHGTVTDNAGARVEGATVILIPSTDISTFGLDRSSFSPTATDDEPLEDLVNDAATLATYQTDTTDSEGNYRFNSITEGTYFIYVKPADSDTGHLPGGSLCRGAQQLTDTGVDLDIEVSTNPSSAATYVGSTACLVCHSDKETITQTGHFNGFRVPGTDSVLQDITDFENFDAALDRFDGVTTVYFYDYDSTRSFDKYKTSETNPNTACVGTAGVRFSARLIKNGSTYKMEFTNVCNPADPNDGITYDVALTYGGAVYKQRYVTQMDNGDYQILPLQYHQEGDDTVTPRTRKIWRDYHAATSWYDETTKLFKTPAHSKSFDNNCAGCHFTGYSLTGDNTDGWVASAVSDTNGTIDYDRDGDLDEINTGCEVCHGPGSEHVASGGAIVQPGLITPERESMICGRCHSRPKGALGTDVPDDVNGDMMLPGLARSTFLSTYTNGVQYDAASGDLYTDQDQHSKSHHQQYTDFIRSSHYNNQEQLVTCSNCHNMHGTDNPRGLVATTSDNALCTTSCHTDKTSVTAHTEDKLGTSTDMGATCVNCHMSQYAKTGAGREGLGNYWENDITGHLFAVPLKTTPIVSGESTAGVDNLMPIPYTNSCATAVCHDSDLSDNDAVVD